jgi:hypothetical protein
MSVISWDIARLRLLTYWQVLKPACIAALKRIFKLCDANKDGILDASELNEFQVTFLFLVIGFGTNELYSGNVLMLLYKHKK